MAIADGDKEQGLPLRYVQPRNHVRNSRLFVFLCARWHLKSSADSNKPGSTIAVMCWRIAVTVQVMGDLDFTLSLATIAVISMLELWLGIICACMPTLSPLLNVYVTPALKRLVSKYSSLKPSAQHGSSSQGQPAGRPRPTSQRRVKGKWSLASSLFNSVGSQERGTGQHASFYGGQRIPEAQITGSAFYSGSEHELIGDPTGGREPKSINAVTNFWQEVENLDAPAVPVPKVTHNWQ